MYLMTHWEILLFVLLLHFCFVNFFINKPSSSSDFTVFMIPLISSFKIVNIVVPDTDIFLKIAASVADADADNSNGIKTLLANGLYISY